MELFLSIKYLKVIIQCLEPKIFNEKVEVLFYKKEKSNKTSTFSLNISGSRHFMMTFKYLIDRKNSILKVIMFVASRPNELFFILTRKKVFHAFQLKFQEHYSRVYRKGHKPSIENYIVKLKKKLNSPNITKYPSPIHNLLGVDLSFSKNLNLNNRI